MGSTNNSSDQESSDTSHRSSLPTRTIYTAVVSVVAANLIAGLTLLVRNPMDEIDELGRKIEQHIHEADKRMDQIERDHVGFEYRINQNHHDR